VLIRIAAQRDRSERLPIENIHRAYLEFFDDCNRKPAAPPIISRLITKILSLRIR
jgi:hypothetical protein